MIFLIFVQDKKIKIMDITTNPIFEKFILQHGWQIDECNEAKVILSKVFPTLDAVGFEDMRIYLDHLFDLKILDFSGSVSYSGDVLVYLTLIGI